MVTEADVMAPKGRVEVTMFPGETPEQVTSRIAAYIAEGDAHEAVAALRAAGQESRVDPAILAWSYHRAFYAAAVLADSRAANVQFQDQGSRAFLQEQLKANRERAQEWLEKFNEITTLEPDTGYIPTTRGTFGDIRWFGV